MIKRKAVVASIVTMALFGGILLCFLVWQGGMYTVLIHLLALYGFITGGFHFYDWLQKEEYEDIDEIQDANYTSLDEIKAEIDRAHNNI